MLNHAPFWLFLGSEPLKIVGFIKTPQKVGWLVFNSTFSIKRLYRAIGE